MFRWRLNKQANVSDDYVIREKLGQGAYATVYRVEKRRTGARYAMKVMSTASFMSIMGDTHETLQQRLDFFTRISHESRHANVMCVVGGMIEPTLPDFYIVVELLAGGDLFSRISGSKGGHLTEPEALDVARSLCSALAYFHDHGVIHRDVKPENILFRRPGAPLKELVLSDFGLSCFGATSETRYQGIAGSLGYTAPEMVAGLPWTMLVDSFAAGITMYEVLTGRSPFRSRDEVSYREELIEEPIPFPKRYWANVSAAAQDFVQSLVVKDPAHRPFPKTALSHDWLNPNVSLVRPSMAQRQSSFVEPKTDQMASISRSDRLLIHTSFNQVTHRPSTAAPVPLAPDCAALGSAQPEPGAVAEYMIDALASPPLDDPQDVAIIKMDHTAAMDVLVPILEST